MNTTLKRLSKKLRNSKEHRDAFVASQISVGIPFQIRTLRKQFGWSQVRLAQEAKMAQPTISSMEGAGYGGFTLTTLRKLASAFDIGLVVKFAPYGEMVHWTDNFSPDTFTVPSAEKDPVLNNGSSQQREGKAMLTLEQIQGEVERYTDLVERQEQLQADRVQQSLRFRVLHAVAHGELNCSSEAAARVALQADLMQAKQRILRRQS